MVRLRLFALIILWLGLMPVYGQSWTDVFNAISSLTKIYQAVTISDEDLCEYMSQTIQKMDEENHCLSSRNTYSKRLAKITSGFTMVNDLPLNFKVYDDPKTVNAFASPDGSVRVYSGLMDIMTDDEIRGVIGHEIGHLAQRHSIKQLRTQLLASAARDGLMLTDGTVAILAASQLGDLTETLLNCHYSRVQETQADEYGYQFLKSAHYSPISMIAALVKLQSIEEQKNSKYVRYVVTLFSTHPDLENRINHLCSIASNEGYSCYDNEK